MGLMWTINYNINKKYFCRNSTLAMKEYAINELNNIYNCF